MFFPRPCLASPSPTICQPILLPMGPTWSTQFHTVACVQAQPRPTSRPPAHLLALLCLPKVSSRPPPPCTQQTLCHLWCLRERWLRGGRDLCGIPRYFPSAWNRVGPFEVLRRHLLWLVARRLRGERTCGGKSCPSPQACGQRAGLCARLVGEVQLPLPHPSSWGGGGALGRGSSPTPVLAPHMCIGVQLHTRPLWPHHPPPADVAVVSRPQRCR